MKLFEYLNEGKELLNNFLFGDDIEVVKNALKNGADINHAETKHKTGSTPLIYACLKGHYALVELLMQHDADPYIADSYGNTAMDYGRPKAKEIIDKYIQERKRKEDWRERKEEIERERQMNDIKRELEG